MMTRELGVSYLSPDGALFVVVEAHRDLVHVLYLQDNPSFRKGMAGGTVFPVLVGTVYWDESVPFSSLPERGKVAP